MKLTCRRKTLLSKVTKLLRYYSHTGEASMDMDISMDIHAKSVDMDMDMDGKFHIHGNPGYNMPLAYKAYQIARS